MKGRRFECKENGHNKFWEISCDIYEVNTKYGKIGGKVFSSTKSFSSIDLRQKFRDAKIKEKLNKGYKEVSIIKRPQNEKGI